MPFIYLQKLLSCGLLFGDFLLLETGWTSTRNRPKKTVTRKKSLRKDIKAKGKKGAKTTATVQGEDSIAVEEEDNGSISTDTEQDGGSSVGE